MAYAFDTLGYARHLREGGIDQAQAEVHAEAVREFVMGELVTKEDLRLALENQFLKITLWLGAFVLAVGTGIVTILKLIL